MKMTTGESEKVIERVERVSEREILIRCYRAHVNKNQLVLFDERY